MRVRLLVAVFVALFLAPMVSAQDDGEFMRVSELEEILAKGPVPAYFRTVNEGSELVSQDIQIKAVTSTAGQVMIVFTTNDFIAAGMSGSPVYVKGVDGREKLLGALAYFMSPFAAFEQWGGISPMQYMNAEYRAARGLSVVSPSTSFQYEGKTFVPIPMGRDLPAEPETLQMLGGEAFTTSTNTVVGMGAVGAVKASVALQPGMPIMVDLLEWRDQTGTSTVVSATGTITYISKDGEIYAFGHPFMGARQARYTFRACTIVGTIRARERSYKIAGKHSEVLGTIEFDGAYGVYGKVGDVAARPVTEFSVDFSAYGKPTGKYEVYVATSPLTPTIMSRALDMVGKAAQAPLPEQPSTVAFGATVDLKGHQSIDYSQIYTSTQFQFGPRMVYKSSYENAADDFINGIYTTLSASRRGFKLVKTRLKFDFSDGIAPSFKVASVKFPTKVRWGINPVVDLLLVSEDNHVTLSKTITVPIDWNKVEAPLYTADTKDTDKQAEKIVGGSLVVYTANDFNAFLSDNEREVQSPLYFLNDGDYLANFRSYFGRSNRMLYSRVIVRKRSGLEGERTQDTEQSVTRGGESADGWVVGNTGLSERRVTVQKEDFIRFSLDLPPVPSGYMVAPTRKMLNFEVVQ